MDVMYLLEQEMKRRNYSSRTLEAYSATIRRFFAWSKKEPKKVTKKDIKDFLNYHVSRGMSGSTLNVHLNALKFLMEEVLCKKILLRMKFSKVPKRLPVVLSKEEVKRLFNAIKNPRHRLMIELLYSAGLRVSELVHLRVEDLDLENGIGWVRRGKGNKDRLFIVAKKLKLQLAEHIKDKNIESWVFEGRRGRHIHVRSIQEIIKKAAKIAKIQKRVHCHCLRHSFATHLIEDGYDVASVQSLLGHSSSATTMIYVHMASPKLINVKSPLDNL